MSACAYGTSRNTSYAQRRLDHSPLGSAAELLAAVAREAVAVESRGQVVEAVTQLVAAHSRGAEVDVEQRTALPRPVVRQPAGALELVVQRCAGEWRWISDLHVERDGLLHEIVDRVEDLRPVSVEADDETGVDPDAVGLDLIDHLPVAR